MGIHDNRRVSGRAVHKLFKTTSVGGFLSSPVISHTRCQGHHGGKSGYQKAEDRNKQSFLPRSKMRKVEWTPLPFHAFRTSFEAKERGIELCR